MTASYGYNLNCYFYQQQWGPSLGDRLGGYCYIDYMDNDHVNFGGVTGELSGRALSDVQVLNVMGQGSISSGPDRMPSNLATLFPDLIVIQWMSSGLKHLSASDFASWPNLLQADFMGNHLRSLDGNLFANNHKLQLIDFSMNPIEVIGDGFFIGLDQLTQISFMSVECVGMSYMSSYDHIENTKADIQHLCGPLPVPGDLGECPVTCEDRFTAIDASLATVQTKLSSALETFRDLIFKRV